MKGPELLEQRRLSDGLEMHSDNSGYEFSIAVVYQDTLTRSWAMQMCRPVTQRAGEEHVQKTWYDVNSLSDPGILPQAVRAALAADAIVVSIYAADELPLELYAWIDVWLPRRRSRAGALAALIGVAEPLDSQSVRTREYLQAVARKGELEFISQKRKRPVAAPVSSTWLIAERASSAPQVFYEIHGQRYDVYSHWGLNE